MIYRLFPDRHRTVAFFLTLLLTITLGMATNSPAQTIFGHGNDADELGEPAYDEALFQELKWRNIGPFRGGRAPAVAGHADHPRLAYMGAAAGGVWKTEDGGHTWVPVSDESFKTAAVGALAVAPGDHNVVYAGMGETDIRGNISAGDGIYKSVDGGRSWKHMGLGETMFIGDIKVHPENEDIVWVAALGHVFGNKGNEERGVYKSTDGGQTWEKVLYVNDQTGAVDLAVDPNNPRILFAGLWEAYRNPWEMSSGGPNGGLWKSTDGGDTWTEIAEHPGLPKGLTGKIGIDVSRAQPGLVYAMIENENGGLFRSEDYGETWQQVNSDRDLRQRAWYYTEVKADPQDPQTVYVLNVRFHRSDDGGKTFKTVDTPHGDHHDLWINPKNPEHLLIADDGGVQVSYNAGKSWSSYHKYATGQFYHVLVDDRFPYNIYGAQQDNSTVRIQSRSGGYGITEDHWSPVAGGESGYIAYDPENENVTYGGSYGGNLQRFNQTLKQRWQVDVWPNNPMGHGARDLKYRFQWTYPILVSPHNPDVIYATSQHVHRSTDEGMSWSTISPDLTRNEKSKQQKSGGPITYDDTSVEYYNTIFTFDESPVEQGVLWAGADDGLIHVSRDNGETWTDVTPEGMPEGMASIIDASPHDPAKAYLAFTRYKFDDFTPYIYKTDNYGQSWERIDKGIPPRDFVRVVREDPHVPGLLYAGTETGVYVSFNDGEQWQPLQLNLPAVPITDLMVQKRHKDLVISTQGRSFWIFDDLGVLHQLSQKVADADLYLFQPEPTYQFGGHFEPDPGQTVGENPADGVVVYYNLKEATDQEVQLQFLEDDGEVIRTYSSEEDPEGKPVEESEKFYEEEHQERPEVVSTRAGLNRYEWNMRYPSVTEIEPQVLWGGSTRGPEAIPGDYMVQLIIGGETVQKQPFEIRKDPRLDVTQEDLEAQFELISTIKGKLDETHQAINRIRKVRGQINELLDKQPDNEEAKKAAQPILDKMAGIERELVQVKSESPQDPLNYPIKLNNKLSSLAANVARGDHRPTEQQYEVYDVLKAQVDEQLKQLDELLENRAQQLMREIDVKEVEFE